MRFERLFGRMAMLFLFFLLADRLGAQSASGEKEKLMAFFQDQQYEEAVNYLMTLYIHDSSNIETLAFLGYANFMNEDPDAAEKYYLKILDIDSTNISALQYLSRIYAKQKTAKALLLTGRLISLQPARSAYFRQQGDLYRRLHENDSAVSSYQFAFGLSPSDMKNKAGLSDLLIETKQFSLADSILDEGLRIDSMNERLLELRVRSAYENKAYFQVLPSGEKLIKIKGLHLTAMTQLALSYYFLKRYDDCIKICKLLEDQGVVSESLYYYESRAWSKIKNYSTSNDLLQKCIGMAISKTAESYYYDLGENDEALGKYTKAITQYDTAFYLFKNPVMKYNCGRIAASNLKNDALARKYFVAYMAIAKPQTKEEQKAFDYLKARWKKRKTPISK
jgi:tetratricopeptide (TPR) repeat protein